MWNLPVPIFNFIGTEIRDYSLQTVKILHLNDFYKIFSIYARLQGASMF